MRRTDTVVKILSGERYTPYGLATKLDAFALLESSSFIKGRERYSLILTRKALSVVETENSLHMVIDGKHVGFSQPARDILDALAYFADQHDIAEHEYPFPAGGVGYISFEFARRCDTIHFRNKPDPLQLPLALFMLGHIIVICDHYTDRVVIVGINYHEREIDLNTAVEKTIARIEDHDFNWLRSDNRRYTFQRIGNGNAQNYHAMVSRVRDEIIEGNLLQGVPSRRIEAQTEIPAIEAYRRLRSISPSPYLFYLNFGKWQLFGASPEMHIRVKNGEVQLRPIAGTRRRGNTTTEDLALADELINDEKERAEHLMLVDLGRNDLGRVCAPGSINVRQYLAVERYSHVMHLVSEIVGVLENGLSGIDAIRATFPAGTICGAPKIRAIETIDRLEPICRRFYSGIVGYLEPGNNLDSCIAIRSAVKMGNKLITQAGGGVVFESTPEREYQETEEKLSAMLTAITMEINA